MGTTDEYEERLRRLTPREARVLVLLLEGHSSTRDIADVLGSSPGAVQTTRQSIRRKLAIPRNGDLAQFVKDMPGLQDLELEIRASTTRPRPDRRHSLVLRSTLRELDVAAKSVRAKAGALASLASLARGEARTDREAMLVEAAIVHGIATELDALRVRALAQARASL